LDAEKRRAFGVVHFADVYQLEGLGCVESCAARNVSADRELKHLLLESEGVAFLAHLPASRRLSFAAVR